MANETVRASQAQSQQGGAGKQSQQRQSDQQASQQSSQQSDQPSSQPSNLPAQTSRANPPAPAPRRDIAVTEAPAPGMVFDPHGAIRVGMLRLARSWADEGHVYSAINTYREVLLRYPGSGVAAAAVEDMLELALLLERRGMYFTALNLFHTMEDLA